MKLFCSFHIFIYYFFYTNSCMKIGLALELVKTDKNPHATEVAAGLHASAVSAHHKKERSQSSCCGAPVKADRKYK